MGDHDHNCFSQKWFTVVIVKISLGTNVEFLLGFYLFLHVKKGIGIGRSPRDEILDFAFSIGKEAYEGLISYLVTMGIEGFWCS